MAAIAKGKYGYFDDSEREYVITRPDTPRPWMNYLMNESYVALISNTGGGVSYDTDPRVYRLLRYRYQNVPYDRPGRYVYVRDQETGKYWSSTWAPVHPPIDKCKYSCRVGVGYQIVTFEYEGIRTELTYFVPTKGRLEIWDLKVTNISRKVRKLSTFSYAEFAFWGALRDLMNIDNCPNISRQRHEAGAILHYSYNDIGTGLHNMNFVQNYGYHISTPLCNAYNGDRDKFLGRYRDEKNPIVVETGKSTNYCQTSGYPIGSLEHRFTLKPGETKRIVYRTGISNDETTWKKDAAQYAKFEEVDAAFAALRQEWNTRLGKFQVKTPDKNFDAMVNGFVQYQSAMTMRLSRSISTYEWGIGRSIGFRDSSQDQMGMMHAFPDLARKMAGYIISAINAKGEACHNFNPVTNSWGTVGAFYDDHNWPALTISQYVRETGDVDFLSEEIPYAPTSEKATVFQHLINAQDNAWSKRGKNGLLQIGAADWNDSLNPGERKTESVFTSMLYCASTEALIGLAKQIGQTKLAGQWQKRYDTIKKLTNTVAWDGGWYQRMIKADGNVLGSKKTVEYGRIFLEPQPWAVMSGVATGQRAITALDNVEKHLGTPNGHRVMDRPFLRFDMKEIGSAGIFPGGIKENGSVFNHASAWVIMAESLLGRGEKAHKYFMQMSGIDRNKNAEVYESEPYVSSQFVSQKPFHIVGRGRNSWLTGSAAWIALGAMQGVIGCRPAFAGLEIDPSIPKQWKGFKLRREYRGVVYDITIKNPNGVSHGVKELIVDGKKVRGTIIPFDAAKKQVAVTVVMG